MRPGGILETILALVLGAVITLYLLIAAVTTYKWAIKTIEKIKEGINMKQNFLSDRALSEMYEKYFAEQLNMQWNKTRHDDHGVDIYDHLDTLDVKVYRKPRYGEYEGFFIETYLPLSNNPGWYCDPGKRNNGYLFVKDAYVEEIKYDKAWTITRYDLTQAIAEARRDAKKVGYKDIPVKKTASGWGYILPYKYIEKYGFEVII